jgi:hypothetical protein
VPVITTEVPVKFRDPLHAVEVALSFAALTFPAPGVYVWQLEIAGEVFHERRVAVQKVGTAVGVSTIDANLVVPRAQGRGEEGGWVMRRVRTSGVSSRLGGVAVAVRL